MKYVASQELSELLYDLSGWKNTSYKWRKEMFKGGHTISNSPTGYNNQPAYDIGYLLRKLPHHVSGNLKIEADGTPEEMWYAYYGDRPATIETYSDTPENALCTLAIELFKQGVLVKQS